MRIWLYALDIQVYKLRCTVDKLIGFLQSKKDELLSVLSDKLIVRILETSKKDVSYFYSNKTFIPTSERINRLHKAIVSEIEKGPSPRFIPNVDDVKKAVEKIKGLGSILNSIVDKIIEVETCLNEINRIKE